MGKDYLESHDVNGLGEALKTFKERLELFQAHQMPKLVKIQASWQGRKIELQVDGSMEWAFLGREIFSKILTISGEKISEVELMRIQRAFPTADMFFDEITGDNLSDHLEGGSHMESVSSVDNSHAFHRSYSLTGETSLMDLADASLDTTAALRPLLGQ